MATTVSDVPENLVVDFDVYDPSVTIPVDRMQEITSKLAELGPLVYSTAHGGHWLVTQYEQVQDIFRNPEAFSSYPNNIVDAGMGKFFMLEDDGAKHTSYRKAMQPLFSPPRMRRLEDEVRGVVTELIDAFAARGECEFIAEFAHEVPARMFLKLMGWPHEDAPIFTEATDIALNGKPTDTTPEEAATSRQEAAMSMFEYFGKVVAARRSGEITGDVTCDVMEIEVEMDGERRPLTDEELPRLFFLMLIAGLHTAQGVLGWSVKHLSENPDQRDRLIADPSLLASAVDEILRMESPIAAGRRVVADIDYAGVALKADDQLVLLTCAANRDARQFEHPDQLDVGRKPNRHVAFGDGPHRCLGQHLAGLEIRVALEELNRRIPDYRPDPEDPPTIHPSQVRGFVRMPIVFTPES